MKICENITHVLEEATSPAAALQAATKAVGEDLQADSCAIFLLRRGRRLSLTSSYGPALDARAEGVAAEALLRLLPVMNNTSVRTLLAAPMVSRRNAIGAITVERAAANLFSIVESKRLSAIASQMVDLLENARLVEFIDGSVDTTDDSPTCVQEPVGELTLQGTGASPGIAIGAASFRQAFPKALLRRDGEYRGINAERERARDAFQKTHNDLVRLQSSAASAIREEHALIFASHLLLLRDPMFEESVEQRIASGSSAAVAVDAALQEIVRRLRDVQDAYIRERIEDIEDVRCRILCHLVGVESEGSLRKQIVVSPRTAPSLIIELKVQGALGIASELGGTTSHGVLLARAMGVPAVTGLPELLQRVATSEQLIIDGDTGTVILRPTTETLTEYRRRAGALERTRTQFSMYRDRVAATADGVQIKLQANVALGLDLELARDNGADGIGLYRTEFPFIARDGLPTVDEQVRIYARAYEAFPNSPISFRVLDLAGDKFLTTGDLGVARNAFHGYRSIRVLFDYPHILRDQTQAFAIAAAGRSLRILIPMVSSLEELRRVKQLISAAIADLPDGTVSTSPSFGAMIEVPAAVEIVGDLATEVDFFSIGTNDLIQYAMVIDREDSRLSSPRDAFHPALLRMIRRVVVAAHAASREVTVCGEIAARPEIAVALIALGVDSLSVLPRAIPELKQKLAGVRIQSLITSIDRLLTTSTMVAIEQILRRYIDGEETTGQLPL